jgi:hypothetical protein
MTVLGVTHWTRRDSTERALLGQAAFNLCKALRAADGIDDSRFYWTGPDTVVIQVTADAASPILQPPSADAARQLFALADLARRDRFETWVDPRTGMAQYDMAGR